MKQQLQISFSIEADDATAAKAAAKAIFDFGLVHSGNYEAVNSFVIDFVKKEKAAKKSSEKTSKKTKTKAKKTRKTSPKGDVVEFTGPKGTLECKKCISNGDSLCIGAPQDKFQGNLSSKARKDWKYACRCSDTSADHNRQFVSEPTKMPNSHSKTHKKS